MLKRTPRQLPQVQVLMPTLAVVAAAVAATRVVDPPAPRPHAAAAALAPVLLRCTTRTRRKPHVSELRQLKRELQLSASDLLQRWLSSSECSEQRLARLQSAAQRSGSVSSSVRRGDLLLLARHLQPQATAALLQAALVLAQSWSTFATRLAGASAAPSLSAASAASVHTAATASAATTLRRPPALQPHRLQLLRQPQPRRRRQAAAKRRQRTLGSTAKRVDAVQIACSCVHVE